MNDVNNAGRTALTTCALALVKRLEAAGRKVLVTSRPYGFVIDGAERVGAREMQRQAQCV